ncbi:MAG TPA: MdtA/MuxA family multidrug efflux RND transporter periplasmic adaptor subunit [Stellaceae bacterium]|nr:MdtA/MuxA family multidrug efflux RND transporter periplasmic adaptor subunit [Stellaceae bacterium]
MDELRVDPERKSRDGEPPQQQARTPTRRPYLWVGLVLVVLAALAWWVHTRPAPQAPGGRFAANGLPMPVVAQPVAKGDIPVTYDALGTVTPLATVTVTTQIAGQIVDVAFREGQEVKKGDVLVQIDPRPYQAALDQATGQLARDQAMLAEARIDLARYQKLAEQNSIARQQAEDQVYVVQQDEGTVRLDQALVDNARLNLGYCRIVAPVSGRIGLRQIDLGNYVQVSSSTAIAVITQMQPITVVFTLPEDELPQVMKRLAAGAKLPVTAYDRSNTQKLAEGTLSAVDSAIDPTTGTVKLKAEFPNTDEALFPNQFVNAELLIDTVQGTAVIPTAAVQRGQPGTFVYVVKPDNTVSVQKVTLGPQAGENVAVSQGLSPGDKIVVDGADKLREGAKVVLRSEQGTAAPAQQGAGGKSGQGRKGAAQGAAPAAPATQGTAPPTTPAAPATQGTAPAAPPAPGTGGGQKPAGQ